MAPLRRVVAVIGLVAAVAAGSAACGSDTSAKGRNGKEVKPVAAGVVPSTLLGMAVTQEDATKYVADIDRTYLEEFSLYSVREGDLLQATLQVSEFNSDAQYQSASFRGSVVNRIGSSKAQLFRMGDNQVYMTTGTKQQIAVWFEGSHMLVLSIRDDFKKPRALIREAMGIKL